MTQTLLTRETVEQRITEALIEFGVNPDETRSDATWDEIDVDSLDLAELTQIIETDYGVALRAADLSAMRTVGDAVELVLARLA
jgi:acyl carrier protein